MEAKFKMLERENDQIKQENTQMKNDLLQIIHDQDTKIMELLNDTRHIEVGILDAVRINGGSHIDQTATFNKPYKTVPMVNVGVLDGQWYVITTHSSFHVNVLQVNQTGFTVRYRCDGDYHVDTIRVSWTSFPTD